MDGHRDLLGSVTFTGETATGWQQANFAPPIAVTANTTYVVGYHAPAGGYAVNPDFFATTGVDNGTLHALVQRRRRRQRGLPLRRRRLVPDRHLPGQQLLGRRRLRRQPRPGGHGHRDAHPDAHPVSGNDTVKVTEEKLKREAEPAQGLPDQADRSWRPERRPLASEVCH